MAAVKVKSFTVALVTGTDRQVIATFKIGKKNLAGFDYDWEYYDGKRWIPGDNGNVDKDDAHVSGKTYRHVYTAPDNATKARCRIRPRATTHKVNKKDTPYWSGGWTSKKTHAFSADALPTPTLDATIGDDGVTVTYTVECDDADCRWAYIRAKKGSKAVKELKNISCNRQCTGTFKITVGETWSVQVQCRTVKDFDKGKKSSWSTAVSVKAKPGKPGAIKASALSGTSAKVTWGAAAGVQTYTAQYVADDAKYFNTNPAAVHTDDGIVGTTYMPTGLEAGHKYFFRVRATNDSGDGAWSGIASTILATVPEAPTTYETDASYMLTETALLRWTHNAEDASEQTHAQVEVNGTSIAVDSDEQSYTLDLSQFADGTQVNWRVRTKGVHPDWSPWSAMRSFHVYDEPGLTCVARAGDASGPSVDDYAPMTEFPLAIVLDASGGGGVVSGYHVTIIQRDGMDYLDDRGEEVYTGAGTVAFDKDFNVDDDPYTAIVDIGDAFLVDTAQYEVHAEVSMQSGLRAIADPWQFTVDFDSEVPEPTCQVRFDMDTLTAEIAPSCYAVVIQDDVPVETDTLQEGVTLNVYRLDRDGTITLLRAGIANDGYGTVTDPHAQFGECWYRVVAVDSATGCVNFIDGYDLSPKHTCTVQWDESWQKITGVDSPEDADYDYSGLRIDGLYNLGHDENGEPEAESVKYQGRKYAVSYYGTQLGYEADYRVDFPKDDDDTLWLARKLLAYTDDFYVREPFGTGFWARLTNRRLSRTVDSQKYSLQFHAERVDRTDVALGE